MLYFLCMKKKIIFTFTVIAVLFVFIFSSCASKQEESEPPVEPLIEQPEIEPEEPEELTQEQPYENDEDDVIVIVEEGDSTDDEYLRSIANLDEAEAVSKQEFTDDKNEILEIISELAQIMESKDTLAWLKYIDDESKEYYKNPVNLRKAQRKLPNKLIELKTIEDYFKFVFIPARKNSQIDEIRYISKTHVKAVQIREDMPDAIYYEYKKENGKWLVYIPPVS